MLTNKYQTEVLQPAFRNGVGVIISAVVFPVPPALVVIPDVCVSQKLSVTLAPECFIPINPPLLLPLTLPVE